MCPLSACTRSLHGTALLRTQKALWVDAEDTRPAQPVPKRHFDDAITGLWGEQQGGTFSDRCDTRTQFQCTNYNLGETVKCGLRLKFCLFLKLEKLVTAMFKYLNLNTSIHKSQSIQSSDLIKYRINQLWNDTKLFKFWVELLYHRSMFLPLIQYLTLNANMYI